MSGSNIDLEEQGECNYHKTLLSLLLFTLLFRHSADTPVKLVMHGVTMWTCVLHRRIGNNAGRTRKGCTQSLTEAAKTQISGQQRVIEDRNVWLKQHWGHTIFLKIQVLVR